MIKMTRRGLLTTGAALVASAATSRFASAQSDIKATMKVASFGGEAQTTAINHAIERFNEKYPNVTVDLSMDPISTGWGDYVTKVLSQFNAGNTADVYGTAIETFQAFASRGPVDAARRLRQVQQRLLGLRAEPVPAGVRTRGTSTTSPSAGTTS